MDEDLSAIDPSDFDPSEASEKLCWAMLPKVENETKAETLISLGRHAYGRGEYESAAAFAEQAQEVWKSIGNDRMEAHAFFNAGCSYKETSQLSVAIERLKSAVNLYLEVGDYFGACKATLEMAGALHGSGFKSDARQAYMDAVAFAKNGDDDDAFLSAVDACVQHLLDHEYFEDVDRFLAAEMPKIRTCTDAIRVADFNASWALAKHKLDKNEAALELVRTAREVADAMLLKLQACARRVLEASILMEFRRFEEANELLDFATDLALELRDSEIRMNISLCRSRGFIELGDFESAYGFASEVFAIAKSSSDPEDAQALRFVLAHSGAMCGHEEEAYQYFIDYKAQRSPNTSTIALRNRATLDDFLEGLVMTRLELIDKSSNQTFDYTELSGALFARCINVGVFAALEYDFVISNALLAAKQRAAKPEEVPACDPENYELAPLICRFEQLDTNNDRKAALHLAVARVEENIEGFFSASMALALYTHTGNEVEAKRAAKWVRKLAPYQEEMIVKWQSGEWVEYPEG